MTKKKATTKGHEPSVFRSEVGRLIPALGHAANHMKEKAPQCLAFEGNQKRNLVNMYVLMKTVSKVFKCVIVIVLNVRKLQTFWLLEP